MDPQLRVLVALGRGSRFSPQHPHGGLQTSTAPVSGGPMPLLELHKHQTRVWNTRVRGSKSLTHLKEIKIVKI